MYRVFQSAKPGRELQAIESHGYSRYDPLVPKMWCMAFNEWPKGEAGVPELQEWIHVNLATSSMVTGESEDNVAAVAQSKDALQDEQQAEQSQSSSSSTM